MKPKIGENTQYILFEQAEPKNPPPKYIGIHFIGFNTKSNRINGAKNPI